MVSTGKSGLEMGDTGWMMAPVLEHVDKVQKLICLENDLRRRSFGSQKNNKRYYQYYDQKNI